MVSVSSSSSSTLHSRDSPAQTRGAIDRGENTTKVDEDRGKQEMKTKRERREGERESQVWRSGRRKRVLGGGWLGSLPYEGFLLLNSDKSFSP